MGSRARPGGFGGGGELLARLGVFFGLGSVGERGLFGRCPRLAGVFKLLPCGVERLVGGVVVGRQFAIEIGLDFLEYGVGLARRLSPLLTLLLVALANRLVTLVVELLSPPPPSPPEPVVAIWVATATWLSVSRSMGT